MNARIFIAATALLAASASVFAQMPDGVGASPYYPEISASTMKTSAEVRMELQQAYQQGMRTPGVTPEYPTFSNFVSHRTRDEVRKEAMQRMPRPAYDVEQGVNG
jgi:hypothetical protein